jgi:hypothetical protein
VRDVFIYEISKLNDKEQHLHPQKRESPQAQAPKPMGGKVIPLDEESAFTRSAIDAEDNPPATRDADVPRKLRRVVGGSLVRARNDESTDGW